MVTVDAFFKLAAAAVTAVLAILLLATPRGERPARYLGVFLALISMNQGAETLRAFASDPSSQILWFKVASVAASLDPVALFLFASALFAPDRPPSARVLLVVGAPAVALALAAGWLVHRVPELPAAPSTEIFPTLLTLYTVITYAVVLFQAANRLERSSEPRWAFLLAGLALAFLPAAGRPFDAPAYFIIEVFGLVIATLVAAVVAPFVLAGGILHSYKRARASRVVLYGIGLALLIHLIARTPTIVQVFEKLGWLASAPQLEFLGRASAPVRWTLFGLFTSMAVFRDEAFGFSLAARRRAARVLIGTGFSLLAVGAIFATRGGLIGMGEALVLAIAIALSQSFRALVDRVALIVYGVPAPGDAMAAHALYRRAAASAIAHGRLPDRDAELQRLREELALDVPTAQLLERLAQESMQGALVPGEVVLGRYRVDRALGRGSGGRALLADDLLLTRKVVLKEVMEENATALREARIIGSLQHPNVVTLHDALQRGSGLLLVTEHVPGGSLADRLAQGALPADAARGFALGLLAGLAAVHEAGVTHGDIKPSNILLSTELSPKLADFGLARKDSTVGIREGDAFGGTFAYMAPEQRAGGPPTPAADLYAAALVLREAVGAHTPAVILGPIERALQTAPERRWASAAEMRDALARAWPAPDAVVAPKLARL